VRAVLQRFGRLTAALCLCWRGKLESAKEQLAEAQNASRLGLYAQVPDVIVHWVRAEICWASGDLEGAERAASVLITQAARAEFEQMAYIGHLLLTQIYRHRDQHARALDEERAHRRRELRVRSDILDSRLKVVQAQLDIRTSERHLEQLARHAQELERLSFEDSLTSIANRRRFDQQLAIALDVGVDPQNSLCVALIDIDNFKQVNDEFSHSMGDDVLRCVAQAIKAAVRASDLPARIGGDEFVVLFPHTGIETAQLVCERIGKKVAAIRWEQWSSELRVSLSIGVAQAQPADTASELLKRSDAAMFQAKALVKANGSMRSDPQPAN
jgi:diguanylate cyclase (GGDEF)-like protein